MHESRSDASWREMMGVQLKKRAAESAALVQRVATGLESAYIHNSRVHIQSRMAKQKQNDRTPNKRKNKLSAWESNPAFARSYDRRVY